MNKAGATNAKKKTREEGILLRCGLDKNRRGSRDEEIEMIQQHMTVAAGM
jgi:hypothetical protein